MDQDYMSPDYLQLEQRQKMNALTQEFVVRSHAANTHHPSSITHRWQQATGLFGSYQWLRTDAPVSFGDAITGPIGNAITNAMTSAMRQSMYPRMYQQMYAQMLEQMMGQGMPAAAAEAAAAKAAEAAANKAVEAAIGGVSMSAEMAVPESFKTPTMNLALFHESNLLLTDRLKLTIGLRLNLDRVKIEYDALAYMNMTGGTADRKATYHLTSHVVDSRQKSFTQLLPKIGLTYDLGAQTGNVYALVAKGYRAGGYNIQMFSDVLQTELNAHQQDAMRGDYDVEHTDADYDAIAETIAYKPEESWNFELGSHLNLFGGSTHLDLALYYMLIRNQQLSIMEPNSNYGRMMVNAGRSHSLGAEATLRGRALDNRLDWALAYGFTSAKFDEYEHTNLTGWTPSSPSDDSYLGMSRDYNGNYVPFVPQHTLSAMADYRIAPRLTVGANLSAQGRTYWDEANSFDQPFYAVLGAHADYDFGPVVVSLWGRNLTNTHYNTFAVQSSAAGGARYFAQRANPIQLGIDLSLHF